MGYPHYSSSCAAYHDLVVDFGPHPRSPMQLTTRPEIVCLCGSTRFVDEFNRQRKELTEAGVIVLSIEVVTAQARDVDPQHVNPELKAQLDELHKRRIDLADRVHVLNVRGYVGESTRSEIEYAMKLNKPLTYLEESHE